MAETTIKLPKTPIGDEIVISSEETGQVFDIVSTNKAKGPLLDIQNAPGYVDIDNVAV